MGTSKAVAAASVEREDDSLFPACLLELFLSHISPAKILVPPWPFLSQPLTHDLSTSPLGLQIRQQPCIFYPEEHSNSPWPVFPSHCHKASSPSERPNLVRGQLTDQLEFVSIFILYTKYSEPLPLMLNTHMDYILI